MVKGSDMIDNSGIQRDLEEEFIFGTMVTFFFWGVHVRIRKCRMYEGDV